MTLETFQADRFGLFIHFGAYAVNGKSEWQKTYDRLTNEDYQTYIDHFKPEAGCMGDWARAAAQAGMKYAVLTTKHHEGFCLFNTQYTGYSTQKTLGRDLVREFVDAFRAEGIKVGFYYSLIDWHHFDFPHFGDLQHPRREDPEEKAIEGQRDFSRYLAYMHGQIRELLTNYGKIDIMWYDFSYNNSEKEATFKSMKGEVWGASEIVQMMHELQPGLIYNNRIGSNGGMLVADPESYAGDFTSPEQLIPPQGMKNELGDLVPWEACVTMNQSWGYSNNPFGYKSEKTLIHALVDSVSKNGNLLLNVGPDARGHFPEPSIQRLEAIGHWMSKNSDSIYGCKAAPFEKPEWGRYTYKPAENGESAKLYAHIYERGIGPLPLVGLEGRLKSARLLADGSLLNMDRPWNVSKFPNDAFLDLPWFDYLPDDIDTVIEFELFDS
ncbi:alpha-L-fucosidase [Lactovum odontotermitis]